MGEVLTAFGMEWPRVGPGSALALPEDAYPDYDTAEPHPPAHCDHVWLAGSCCLCGERFPSGFHSTVQQMAGGAGRVVVLGHPGDGPPEGDAHYSTDMARLHTALGDRRMERRWSIKNGLTIRRHGNVFFQTFPRVARAERRHRSDLTLTARLRAARR